MNGRILVKLGRIRKLIERHPGPKDYGKNKGDEASRRFWNLFRTSLSRCAPDQIAQMLRSEDNKLAEMGDLGPQLADQFFNNSSDREELTTSHEALILACLEMDAAWRLRMSRADDRRKEQLRKRLDLWRVA